MASLPRVRGFNRVRSFNAEIVEASIEDTAWGMHGRKQRDIEHENIPDFGPGFRASSG